MNKVRLLIVELGEDDVEDYAKFFWHSAIILAIACFARSWILSCWVKGEVPGVEAELDDGDQHPGGGVSVAPVAPRLLL